MGERTESRKVRVLVVDDSLMMRALISDIVKRQDGMDVVGTADNGIAALEKIEHLRPDVVTMDVEMPRMDGLQALEEIMKKMPTPVVMVSSLTRRGSEETIKALQRGAVDIVLKPEPGSSGDRIKPFSYELLRKIRLASVSKVQRPQVYGNAPIETGEKKLKPGSENVKNLVVIGSSTGGPEALTRFLPKIPANIPAAILVVQHMPAGFTNAFAKRLDRASSVVVREAKDGDIIRNGLVLVAPGHAHIKIVKMQRACVVRLETDGPVNGHMPSVDRLFLSAAETFGSSVIGVIMTGMGRDGVDGLEKIYKAGGKTAAQSEESCVVYGMPKEAVKAGCIHASMPPEEMAGYISKKLGVPVS